LKVSCIFYWYFFTTLIRICLEGAKYKTKIDEKIAYSPNRLVITDILHMFLITWGVSKIWVDARRWYNITQSGCSSCEVFVEGVLIVC